MSDDPLEGIRRTGSPEPEEIASAHRWKADDTREVCRSRKTFLRRCGYVVCVAIISVVLLAFSGVAKERSVLLLTSGLGLMLLAAVLAWRRLVERIAGYCPRCDSCVEIQNMWTISRPRWCHECDYLFRPDGLPAYTGDWDIDLDQIRLDEDSRYKLLIAILSISLQLQFDELTFEPTREDYHVRAKLGGEWCELAEVAVSHRGIVATSRWIWGFDPNGEGYEEGDLILSINGQSAIVEAIFEPNDVGEALTFRFQHRSEPSAQRIPPDSGVLVG